MDAQTAGATATAFFYFVGGVAVLVGGWLAARRFFFEQPYQPIWDHELRPCHVRRMQTGKGKGKYAYSVRVHVTNRSKSWQKIARTWIEVLMPGEDRFYAPLQVAKTAADAASQFGSDGVQVEMSEVGPNQRYGFGQMVFQNQLEHALRVHYCIEFHRQSLFWPGYTSKTTVHTGSGQVAVDLDDLKFYAPSATTVTPS